MRSNEDLMGDVFESPKDPYQVFIERLKSSKKEDYYEVITNFFCGNADLNDIEIESKIDDIKKISGISKAILRRAWKKEKKRWEENVYGKEDEQDDETRNSSSFVDDGKELYEQVVGEKFIDSRGKMHTQVEIGGEPIFPLQGEELDEGREIVLLSEGVEDYGDVEVLIEDIRKHINAYYDCDEQTELFSSWYVLLTWVYDRLSTINYLRAMGDFGTGKSRFNDTVGRICYKPIIGSGAGSVASLKRMVKKWKGTVMTDEGDFKEEDERGELVKFYNLGFEKNRVIYQCNKNDPNKIEFYDPFCPKIILTRRPFKDMALESRCLTHITRVTNRKDIPILLPSKFYLEEKILRKKLLKFRFDYYRKIDCDKILDVNLGNLEPRIKQGMISFTVLFSNIPEVLDKFKTFLKEYQNEVIEERSNSFDGQIMNEIINLIIDGHRDITPKMIVDALPQGKYANTPATIGKRLKSLGVETKQTKIDGKNKRVIVFDDKFTTIVRRYCTDENKVSVVSAVSGVSRSWGGEQKKLSLDDKQKIKKNIHLPDTPDTPGTADTKNRLEKVDTTIHKCHLCGDSPCDYMDFRGRYVCENCKLTLVENCDAID